jgi:hypothetical protein
VSLHSDCRDAWRTARHAPRAAEAPPSDGKYLDLLEWVRHYDGYTQIDWAAWDAAVENAKELPAPEPRCAHCGGAEQGQSNLLLRVAQIGPYERGWIHAKCWTPWRGETAKKSSDEEE